MSHATVSACLLFIFASWNSVLDHKGPLPPLTSRANHSGATAAQERATGGDAHGTPVCDVQGEYALTIKCSFSPSSKSLKDSAKIPLILLERAELSFDVSEENYMTVSLTFRREGGPSAILPYTVYIAIDDDDGLNVVRRPLPSVDFAKLKDVNAGTFTDRVFIGVFPPNKSYSISLWIPDPDPSRKYLSKYNLLLANELLPDPKSGLNRLARFSVKGRKPRAKRPPKGQKSDP